MERPVNRIPVSEPALAGMCTTWSGLPPIWIVWPAISAAQTGCRARRIRDDHDFGSTELFFRFVKPSFELTQRFRTVQVFGRYRRRPAFPGGDSGQTTFPVKPVKAIEIQ